MKKRIFALILTIIMGMSIMSTSALASYVDEAETDGSLDKIINKVSGIENSKEAWGLSDVDFYDLQIGNPVYSYVFVAQSFEENAKLYPIFEGNRLLFWAIDSNDVITITTDLVEEINDVVDFEEPFSIIYDRYGCYICTKNYCELLIAYEDNLENESRSILVPEVACKSEDITFTKLADNSVLLNLPHTVLYTADNSYSCNVPCVDQFDEEICWAACVASIVNYKTGWSLTARDVAQRYLGYDYNHPLNISFIPDILAIYGVNYYNQPIYPSDYVIYKNLLDHNPLYSRWITSGNGPGHACVIFGIDSYAFGGSISLMDPQGGIYRTAEALDGGYLFYHPLSGSNYFLHRAVVNAP